ncbi:hypothetical protein WR37_23235 [Vibrio parahaemolyticus]|nr:hypothetical protein WR37_23235 [Vibrio parahaemolyticus]
MGLARSELFTSKIIEQTNWITSVIIEPGEDELEALNSGVQRVLAGLEKEQESSKEEIMWQKNLM